MLMICPSCGYDSFKFDLYIGESSIGEICPCCFFEFGCEEMEITFVEQRMFWIKQGSPFMDTSIYSPENWTRELVIEQLNNLKRIDFDTLPLWVKELNSDWNTMNYKSLILENWNKS